MPPRDPGLDPSEPWIEQQSRPLHGRPIIRREEDFAPTAESAQDRDTLPSPRSAHGAEPPSKTIYQCMHCLKMLPPTESTSISAPTSSTRCYGMRTHTSSSSAFLEDFPVHFRLQLSPSGLKKKGTKQRLQMLACPCPKTKETKTTQSTSSAEQYYSCVSSDESENDIATEPRYIETLEPCEFPRQVSQSERNLYILKLLHEVVHLINEDSPIREEAFRITNALKTSSALDKEKSSQSSAGSRLRAIPHPLEPPGANGTPSTTGDRQDYVCVEVEPPKVISDDGETRPYETIKDRSTSSSEDLCICPKVTDICPKHGPVDKILKLEDLCTCPKPTDICPVHGLIVKILKLELEKDYCLCETLSSIKQKTSETTAASQQALAAIEGTASSAIETSKQPTAEEEQATSAVTTSKLSSGGMEEMGQTASSRPLLDRIDEATSTVKQSLIDEATSTVKQSLEGEEERSIAVYIYIRLVKGT